MKLEVFHTQSYKETKLKNPSLAKGSKQWLGDGYYFWQDEEFAQWWGNTAKRKNSDSYDIYKAELEFEEDEFIDTVFNKDDYYNFVRTIEKFASKFQRKHRKVPSLEEFNLFLNRFGIWEKIKIIRFQEVPPNDYFVEVKGFYYKKRIQIRVNNRKIISSFVHFSTKECINI